MIFGRYKKTEKNTVTFKMILVQNNIKEIKLYTFKRLVNYRQIIPLATRAFLRINIWF